LDVGAILEPLGVAIHAVRRAEMPPNATVLVFGAGAVGLLTAAMAKVKGASEVVIADIDQGRIDFAVQNGFAHSSFLVPMKRGKDIDENLEIARETAAAIASLKTSKGDESVGEVDAVFECTGVPSCVQASIYVSHPLYFQLRCQGLMIFAGVTSRGLCNAHWYGYPHSDPTFVCRSAT